MSISVVWLRRDLRLADNPALDAAARRGSVVPVYILESDPDWPLGAAARCWLHDSLKALARDLAARGSRLILQAGDAAVVLPRLVRQVRADAVCWNRRYGPAEAACDERVARALRDLAVVDVHPGSLLFAPERIATGAGTPYRVFTPFYQACLKAGEPRLPSVAPPRLAAPARWPSGLALPALNLLPQHPWHGRVRSAWLPGEAGAQENCDRFIEQGLEYYASGRDQPEPPCTSRLSPYLCHGEISAREVYYRVSAARAADPAFETGARAWLRQLFWREFAYHLLHHFPHTASRPLRSEFERLEWVDDAAGFDAWCRGRTGFPIVDAGMRELWQTGHMHNRVRMIAASFLVKHLGVSWLRGARWFWDTLVDADLANNTLGWQWVAGCGADAAPYFRILNPLRQSRRFDPAGNYIRRWIGELADLDADSIHEPPAARAAYPAPLCDLALARAMALQRFDKVKR